MDVTNCKAFAIRVVIREDVFMAKVSDGYDVEKSGRYTHVFEQTASDIKRTLAILTSKEINHLKKDVVGDFGGYIIATDKDSARKIAVNDVISSLTQEQELLSKKIAVLSSFDNHVDKLQGYS